MLLGIKRNVICVGVVVVWLFVDLNLVEVKLFVVDFVDIVLSVGRVIVVLSFFSILCFDSVYFLVMVFFLWMFDIEMVC